MPEPEDVTRSTLGSHQPPADGGATPSTPSFPSEIHDLPGELGFQSTSEEDKPTGIYGQSSAASSLPDELPHIAGYEVLGEIARGGMGRVLAARDLALQRDVAIKVLLRGNSQATSRFIRESIITARLPHPGVPPVHAIGTLADGSPFLAMKLIKGQTLASMLKDRPDPRHDLPVYIHIFEQVCLAVGFAHSEGIIHRDLKPLNIMVGAFGEVQVMDWGLAREINRKESGSHGTAQAPGTAADSDQTFEGSVIGTLAYMPPEQARGEQETVGPRSDVFSLGGMLCNILTGHPPYTASTVQALLNSATHAELKDAFTRLDACAADIELMSICKQCLNPDMAKRPLNGKAVADAVASYREGQEKRARIAETERAAATAREEEAVQRVEAETRAKQAAESQAAEAIRRAEAEEKARLAAEAQALENRKRRRLQQLLACVLLLMMACGGGFAWWQDRQSEHRKLEQSEADARNARSEAARSKAETEVELQRQVEEQRKLRNGDAAAALLAEVEGALRAGNALKAAETLEQARKRIAEGGADDSRGQVGEMRSEELAMLRVLDRIDNDRWVVVDGKVPKLDLILPRWAKAFADYGILPASTSPEEAGRRVRDSFIRERLLTSLEIWFVESDRKPELYRILKAADPDEFRNEVRGSSYSRVVLSWAFRGKPLPLSQPVWFAIGQGMNERVDRGPREQLMLRAHQEKPDNYPLLMSLTVLDESIDKDSALRRAGWCRSALAVQSNSVTAWNNLGAALDASGDLLGAIAAYKAAIRIDSKSAPSISNLGKSLRDLGDLSGAIEACREAIRLDSKYAPAHVNLGNALRDSGDLPGALASFKEAIALDPKSARAHNNLGAVLVDSGNVNDGIACYQQAIRLDPKYAEAYYNFGVTLKDSGDFRGAIACYREAIRLNPKYSQAYNNLGIALFETGNLQGAIACYKEAIRLNPQDAGAHNNLGLALVDSGNMPGSIAAFKEAIRLNPKFALAHFNLGATLKDSGDVPGAIACYKEAIRLDPKYSQAHNNLGIALKETGNITGAIASYKQAIQSDPKNASAQYNLGVALSDYGDIPGAIACYQQVVRLDPTDAQAYYNLGILLKTSGDIPSARAALSEAARLDPKRWGPALAGLPAIPLAPPPREIKH